MNGIEICDDGGNELAVWHDDDLRLRLEARDLLEAAKQVVASCDSENLAEAVRELSAAIATAKGGAA
jgi:hypothetical protein